MSHLLATAAFAVLNPMSLAQGLIVKIILIVGLVRAIKAARAYESHTRKLSAAGEVLE